MAVTFIASVAKLTRARALIIELQAVLDEYLKSGPVAFKEPPLIRPDGSMRAEAVWKPVDHKLNTALGDAIHNLRSALDVMATELVRITPGANPKNVYFPFAESEAELDRQIKSKNFHRAGSDAVMLLKTFSPYRGGNVALRALHDLDVLNKHQDIVRSMTSGLMAITIQRNQNGQFEFMPPEVFDIKYFFPDDSALAGMELLPTLEDIVQMVDGILQSFTLLVASRTP